MLRRSWMALLTMAALATTQSAWAQQPTNVFDQHDAPVQNLLLGGDDDGADTDLVHWYRHRGYYGYRYAYRPYYGYSYSYSYRPSYYYARPYYGYSYSYYAPRYYYSRPYYGGYYYGGYCGISEVVNTPAVRLGDIPAVPAVPQQPIMPKVPDNNVQPQPQPNGNGSFQYDGGPSNPVPMPQQQTQPNTAPAQPKAQPRQSDGILISYPPQPALSYPAFGQSGNQVTTPAPTQPTQQPGFAFPAYGQQNNGASGFAVDRR